jgi:phospholipase C
MYVVSPWSKGGWVCSEVFDHTSLALFFEKRFGFTVPNVSPWHRAVCGDLTSAFDFSGGKDAAFAALPPMDNYAATDAEQRARGPYVVPTPHQPLLQERGTRPSRALGYELHTELASTTDSTLALEFRNTGSKGAVFHVYDRLHLDRIPRRYTVEAGKSLSDNWDLTGDQGKHDLWVYGPHGYVRVFRKLDASEVAMLSAYLTTKDASPTVSVELINSKE